MEHGGLQNGTTFRSNHDRDLKAANGMNGAAVKREPSPNKAAKPGMVNGDANALKQAPGASDGTSSASILPPEITHITENFFSLSFILQRLAQKSHNELQAKIEELAQMPAGQSATNGAGPVTGDDTSEAAQNKKASLLAFVQDMHSKWVKALVMSEWSRKSGQVSKLIDLHAHILEQLRKYNMGLDRMGHIKRNLYGARLPDPDIKTALQVLSTGQAPWMPDFGYIPPPLLDAQEITKWINELNVLLSFRLKLHDFDNVPPQFKDYSIDNGRATFKVKGEFEVDLTIGDDDFEKQWWFLDFRFAFSPAPQELTEKLRHFVETKVNDTLATNGLKGCYEFLHEFILTHKITELRRQAVLLSRAQWVDNLKIEPLNRALSIQYWTTRYSGTGPNASATAGPKSWIIIGVNSGKTPRPNAPFGTPPTSYLKMRWFRDGKEVLDEDLSFETDDISAERLLKRVIGKHVKHILSSIYSKLLSKPRYQSHRVSVLLDVNDDEPSESSLAVQNSHTETLTVRVNAVTGSIHFSPLKIITSRREAHLNFNSRIKDSVEDGFKEIEVIRCLSQFDQLVRRGRGLGWINCKPPVSSDEMKKLFPGPGPGPESYQAVWLRHLRWPPKWHVVVCLSPAGDVWHMVSIHGGNDSMATKNGAKPPNRSLNRAANMRNSGILDQTGARILTIARLPDKPPNPDFSVSFFVELATVTGDIMVSSEDQHLLAAMKVRVFSKLTENPSMPDHLKMPALEVFTADLLKNALQIEPSSMGDANATAYRRRWAENNVEVLTQTVCDRGGSLLQVRRQVKLDVKDATKFAMIKKGPIGSDVFYDPACGQFEMTLSVGCDASCIPLLVKRLKAVDRVVEFVASIGTFTSGVTCDSVTLSKFVFTYGTTRRWRVTLDLQEDDKVNISLEPDNPHMQMLGVLEDLVNSPGGLEQLPKWLRFSLPLQQAIATIETNWSTLSDNGQGSLEVLYHAIGTLSLRFRLPPTTPTAAAAAGGAKPPDRMLQLNVQAKKRKGALCWSVSRFRADNNTSQQAPPQDEFTAALQSTFTSRATPDGWQGLGDAAIGKEGDGIGALILHVSDSIQALAAPSSGASGASQGAAIVLD